MAHGACEDAGDRAYLSRLLGHPSTVLETVAIAPRLGRDPLLGTFLSEWDPGRHPRKKRAQVSRRQRAHRSLRRTSRGAEFSIRNPHVGRLALLYSRYSVSHQFFETRAGGLTWHATYCFYLKGRWDGAASYRLGS